VMCIARHALVSGSGRTAFAAKASGLKLVAIYAVWQQPDWHMHSAINIYMYIVAATPRYTNVHGTETAVRPERKNSFPPARGVEFLFGIAGVATLLTVTLRSRVSQRSCKYSKR
jgi:hypothetical protein